MPKEITFEHLGALTILKAMTTSPRVKPLLKVHLWQLCQNSLYCDTLVLLSIFITLTTPNNHKAMRQHLKPKLTLLWCHSVYKYFYYSNHYRILQWGLIFHWTQTCSQQRKKIRNSEMIEISSLSEGGIHGTNGWKVFPGLLTLVKICLGLENQISDMQRISIIVHLASRCQYSLFRSWDHKDLGTSPININKLSCNYGCLRRIITEGNSQNSFKQMSQLVLWLV